MPLMLAEHVEYRLEGEFVKADVQSGKEVVEMAFHIAQFIDNHRKAMAIIEQWHAIQAGVVPFARGRKKPA